MEDEYSAHKTILIRSLHFSAVPLQAVFTRPSSTDLLKDRDPESLLDRTIDLDEVAIDAAPFQLVLGSSLYKVHTLFSLLGLSHAYVTDCGRLVGVVGLKELRDALANIYVRGAVVPERKLTSAGLVHIRKQSIASTENNAAVLNGADVVVRADQQKFGNSLTVPECL
ncbi:Chloride channel protein [Trichostrongylus colubriformis]|uniref:Chloride channel protein n=1 Tax=Trichostrongylus colubriformis TaxID=6319 RepID=A0AAN8J054_TRICO